MVNNFVDVTLAYDYDKQTQAHKVVTLAVGECKSVKKGNVIKQVTLGMRCIVLLMLLMLMMMTNRFRLTKSSN